MNDSIEWAEVDARSMDDPERDEEAKVYGPAAFVAACNRHGLDPDQTLTEAIWNRYDRDRLPADVFAAFDLLGFGSDMPPLDQRDWQRWLIAEAVEHPEWRP